MPAIRVVKVGGSLLDWPGLPRAFNAWLGQQSAAIHVLIAGGGRAVDAIREESRIHSLDDESAHWLSIDAMSTNSRLLVGLLANAAFISTYGALRSAIQIGSNVTIVFDPNEFLREHEANVPGHFLPHNWSVTSDSIAARLAEVLPADELVLLKSTNPPQGTTAAIVEAGFLDAYFPAFDHCGFRRQFVNLRPAAKCPAAVQA